MTYDTIILGSSPNALTTAAYLARSGERVLVLEPSGTVGGANATAQFFDGFHADLGLMSGRLNADIIKELKLESCGLETIERDTITSLLPEGKSFSLSGSLEKSAETISSFSTKDADSYKKMWSLLEQASDFLKAAQSMTPPPHGQKSVPDMTALVAKLRGYGKRQMTEIMRLLLMPVRDMLDEWFENPALKGLLATAAVRGLSQGPFAGGTTFNLLHHIAIGDGYFRSTAKGGTGAICKALAEAATTSGVEIRTKAGIARIDINNGVASGVELASKEKIVAGRIISDLDVRYTFRHLIDPTELQPEFNRAVQCLKYNSSVVRINLALKELPKFAAGITEKALSGTLVIAPSVAYIEKAFDSAKRGTVSTEPYLEFTIPTINDSSLAPSGKHVMSIWLQYAPYSARPDAEQVLNIAIKKISEFAPGLKELILKSQVLCPQDFQDRYLLTEGHLYGADMTLSQAFFLRPMPGYAQYSTPIEQLYLCGPATHPGGGISGVAGLNLAKVLNKTAVAVSV